MTPDAPPPRARPVHVFVQFLNPEIMSLYGMRPRLRNRELLRAVGPLTRLGLLLGERGLVIPHTYLSEVPEIDAWLDQLKPAVAAGLVHVASASRAGADLIAKKRMEYRGDLELFPGYTKQTPPDLGALPWIPRVERSSAADIARAWRNELEDDGLWQRLMAAGARHGLDRPLMSFEEGLAAVPQRLDGRAFVMRYVRPLMPFALDVAGDTSASLLLSRAYLESYLDELDAQVLVETEHGPLDCGLLQQRNRRVVRIRRVRELLQAVGVLTRLERSLSLPKLLALRAEPVWGWFAERACADAADESRPLLGAYLAAVGAFDELPGRGKPMRQVRDRLLKLREAVDRDDLPAQLELPAGVARVSALRARRRVGSRVVPGQQTFGGNDVFLVCGRDTRAIAALKAMLAAANIHVVEWEEARGSTGDASPYVLDVIEAALERVRAVLVLITPEESVELLDEFKRTGDREQDQRGEQARPNVLVELGMALAVFGRERTVIVEIGPTRGMTDLEGVHTMRFDGSPEKRANLMGRLRDAGLEPRGDGFLSTPGFDYLDPSSNAAPTD